MKEFAKSGWRKAPSFPDEEPDAVPDLMKIRPSLDPEWKSPLCDDAKAYLKGRMVDRAPFLKEDMFTYRGAKGDYILIPWVVNGVDAYWQLNDYRKLGGIKYIFPKNSRKLVYGLDNVDLSWPYVLVFEGVYDSLFVKNGVAVGTKSLSSLQERLIRERYPNHRICLSFDNDGPGLDATAKAVEKGGDFLFFRWFDESTKEKDVNDRVLAVGDPAAFSRPAELEKSVMAPLQMKMWLAQKKGVSFGRKEPPAPRRRGGTLLSRRGLFE